MNYNQKNEAAKDPNTPPEILEQLAADENPGVCFWVALNPNTSPKILQKLATDKAYLVRHYVSQHPNCNQIIERLVFMTDYQQNNK